MIDFLTNHRYQDGILSQSFKILILLHLSSSILSVGSVGQLFAEKGGMKMMVQIMDERMAEERINWKIIERLVQGLFVLCFKEDNVYTLKKDNVIKKLVDTLIRSLEFR
jgi:hypothetical protein